MNSQEITTLLDSFCTKQERTIVIVDYGNVEKWKKSLHWIVGMKELGQLARNFSRGNLELRRFYYGSDYGSKESSMTMIEWSRAIIEKAEMSKFTIFTKRVKYIHDNSVQDGFEKKCDFDVEMAIDLIKLKDLYDIIILFSGDGDLMCAIDYLHEQYNKDCYVFGARGHVGREVFDSKSKGSVIDIFFVEDFEYRLNKRRFSL
ncbi:MAG: NYN domain-containing protein [Candidatus Komeilibacteria bacterium]|nr:NYN domain-containing protein [Candidatus Komeilibacteria bacterium]